MSDTRLKNAPMLTVTVVAYRYNLEDKVQATEYAELSKQLSSQGLKLMRVYGEESYIKSIVSGDTTLDCGYIFRNQWNAASDSVVNPDKRIYEWYEDIYNNARIRQGYYIKITDEMRYLQRNTHQCGYCGKIYGEHEQHGEFCEDCLGSPHLNQDDLPLLRLLPVSESFGGKRPKLTESESAYLVPKYIDAQTSATAIREKQKRENAYKAIEEKFNKAVKSADHEYRGFLWLLDNMINIDNCIYYSHKDAFCFGWRNNLSADVKESLTEKLTDFPFEYEFK